MGSEKKLVVLLVEHDADDIFMCRMAVERAKLNVELHIVTTIDRAIEWLIGDEPYDDRNAFPVPHMIVTDLRTENDTGIKLVRWARTTSEYRDLPIVVHSGSFQPGQADECMHAGATATITKEPMCRQLVEAITAMVDRTSLCGS
jgi:CheY-like chemotaxis protein